MKHLRILVELQCREKWSSGVNGSMNSLKFLSFLKILPSNPFFRLFFSSFDTYQRKIWPKFAFNGATKLHLTHYSCVVIIFFQCGFIWACVFYLLFWENSFSSFCVWYVFYLLWLWIRRHIYVIIRFRIIAFIESLSV